MLSSQAHFASNGAPSDTDSNNPKQYSPNFPTRCADSSQKMVNSLQYTGYHNSKYQNAVPAKQHTRDWPQNARTAMNSRKGVHTRAFPTSFQHVVLSFTPLFQFLSRRNLRSNTRYGRLKWVETTYMGRSEIKFTQAVVSNPEDRKMSSI